MTHLAWSYSQLSKYAQYPGQAHMDGAVHVLRYLRGTYDQAIIHQSDEGSLGRGLKADLRA